MFPEMQKTSPSSARATLLIAQQSSRVYDGLMATLRALPDCEVQSWQYNASAWSPATFDRNFDIVIGDRGLIDDASRSANVQEWRRLVDDLQTAIVVVSTRGRKPATAADRQALATEEPVASTGEAGGLTPRTLERAKNHLEQSLSQPLDLRELASLARLSVSHFSRAFKRSVGMPPHRYLLTRRLAVAAQTIMHSDRTLTEIALDLGFSDQSHFTRMFNRAYGETPGALRRRRLA
ncbi:MAG: AraC family transcriptional regulator [Variovorax sp.]|jgi:AraC-like DNA-binding protein|nr:AraC family transcriptional regulator [Variovorax sp.]